MVATGGWAGALRSRCSWRSEGSRGSPRGRLWSRRPAILSTSTAAAPRRVAYRPRSTRRSGSDSCESPPCGAGRCRDHEDLGLHQPARPRRFPPASGASPCTGAGGTGSIDDTVTVAVGVSPTASCAGVANTIPNAGTTWTTTFGTIGAHTTSPFTVSTSASQASVRYRPGDRSA